MIPAFPPELASRCFLTWVLPLQNWRSLHLIIQESLVITALQHAVSAFVFLAAHPPVCIMDRKSPCWLQARKIANNYGHTHFSISLRCMQNSISAIWRTAHVLYKTIFFMPQAPIATGYLLFPACWPKGTAPAMQRMTSISRVLATQTNSDVKSVLSVTNITTRRIKWRE